MNELNMEQERPAFEAAYRAKWSESCSLIITKFDLDTDNEYLDYIVQVAFEMWLAAKRATMGSAEPSAIHKFDLSQEKQEFEIWYVNRNIIKKSPVSIFVKTKSGDYTHSFMRDEFENWLMYKKNTPQSINANTVETPLMEFAQYMAKQKGVPFYAGLAKRAIDAYVAVQNLSS